MAKVRCIRRSETTHGAIRPGKVYELVDVIRYAGFTQYRLWVDGRYEINSDANDFEPVPLDAPDLEIDWD